MKKAPAERAGASGLCSRAYRYSLRRVDDFRRFAHLYTADERRVLTLKDTHPGETCFVVGNGPSLRTSDLEALREKGCVCFACNKIYKIFPHTDWRPDYYSCTDELVFTQNCADILSSCSCPIFLPRQFKPTVAASGAGENRELYYVTIGWRHNQRPEFYPQAANILSGGSVTFFMIEAAWMMGFRKICLIGCDNSYSGFADSPPATVLTAGSSFRDDYFIENYMRPDEKISSQNSRLVNESFRLAQGYITGHGGQILNATRGGRLELFERADLDTLIREI